MLGELPKEKFVERKLASADRCPRELGTLVKTSEVVFHHEVSNQHIWKNF
jgi:glutamine synthetase